MPHRKALGLSVAFALLATGCVVELQHDLTEDDANDIYVLLQKNGIEATKQRDEGGNEPRYVISVAKQDIAAAAELLRENSLPRPKAAGLSAFRLSKGMIPTQTEERAMYNEALSGEVDNALNKVPGVLEAKTIVVIPEVNDLTQPDNKPLPSASVLVRYRPQGEGRPPLQEEQVKNFVATAVPEMRREQVTVLMAPVLPSVAELSEESHLQTVLGLRMTKGSVSQFRLMVALGGLLILAMAGVVTWTTLRGMSSGSGRGRQRSRSEA